MLFDSFLEPNLLASPKVEAIVSDGEAKLWRKCADVGISEQAKSDQRIFTARYNRLLTEHLFAMGHYQSALNMALECDDVDKVFIDIFQEALDIKKELSKGNTEPAHKWFQEAKYRLKHADVRSLIIFHFLD